jgi:hypothetical protein
VRILENVNIDISKIDFSDREYIQQSVSFLDKLVDRKQSIYHDITDKAETRKKNQSIPFELINTETNLMEYESR